MDITCLSSVFLSTGTTVATLAFSGKVNEVIQLFKALENGLERKSDAKMMSFIGILSVPSALFASKDFIIEFTLTGVTSSVEKDEIPKWVLFNAFFHTLTMLGWSLYWLAIDFRKWLLILDSAENDILEGLKPLECSTMFI